MFIKLQQFVESRSKDGKDFEMWWEDRFGHAFDCLTQSETRYLTGIGWVRRTTRTGNLEVAIERACDWYDETRYRMRVGLTPEIKRIGDIARETVQEMQTEMAAGRGKRIYTDYCMLTPTEN